MPLLSTYWIPLAILLNLLPNVSRVGGGNIDAGKNHGAREPTETSRKHST